MSRASPRWVPSFSSASASWRTATVSPRRTSGCSSWQSRCWSGKLVPIRLGPDEGEVAPSTTFTFALLLAYGVAAAAVAQAIACIVADVVNRKPPVRSAFNVAQYVLAIAAAGAVYGLIAGDAPSRTFELIDLLATGCAGVVFFLVNTGAVAIAVALSGGTRLGHEVSTRLDPPRDHGGDPDRAGPSGRGRTRVESGAAASAHPAPGRRSARRAACAAERAPGAPRRAHGAAQSRSVRGSADARTRCSRSAAGPHRLAAARP